MLFFIGLGLGDEKDITLKGYEIIKSCDYLFLDHYTSLLCVDKTKLVFFYIYLQEEFYGKEIVLADRDLVESHAEKILNPSKDKNVAFLVVGDPFGATTHTDLFLRAKEKNIDVKVIHNASIMNAVGCCGLQLYNFGQTVSIPYFTDTVKPISFYDKIKVNLDNGLHTLCLLDIRVKEIDYYALVKGIKQYEPERYMSVNEALEQLVYAENEKKEGIANKDTKVVGLARIGQIDQIIGYGTIEKLLKFDFGKPLHCLIIPSKMHELEEDMLKLYEIC